MNRKMTLLMAWSLVMGLCGPGMAFANEEPTLQQEEQEVKNAPVGARRMSIQDEIAIQEGRWNRANEEETASNEEELNGPVKGVSAGLITRSEAKKGFFNINYASHPGAYHFPVAVSAFGETVELGDGSIWNVKQSDRFLTLDWLMTDTIFITSNNDFFSSYKYCLINQNTGAQVRVNMVLGPLYNGPMSYWVTWVDISNRQIFLNDGSRWQISIWDTGAMRKWMQNDSIVIGINTGLGQSFNPHLLINVELNDYIEAELR